MNEEVQLEENSKIKLLKATAASFLRHFSLNIFCTNFITYSRATNNWGARGDETVPRTMA